MCIVYTYCERSLGMLSLNVTKPYPLLVATSTPSVGLHISKLIVRKN